jgi:hypothetical protein
MRRAHRMRGNKGCELPTDAIWCDTETKQEKMPDGSDRHFLWFGWACFRRTVRKDEWTGESWHRFETVTNFWDWAESKLHGKIKLYIFAHNWGFDAPVLNLFNELPARGWKLVSTVIDSPPVILKFRREGQTICIIDTLNIFKVPLAVIGKNIGLPKLAMPLPDAPLSEWDAYGKRDPEIIMRATMDWWQFLRAHDLGGFAPTISSQAMRTFRHKFMKHDIMLDDHAEALELARASYFGGRTECFYIGKLTGPMYKLDINAMYPYIMRTVAMPARLIGHYKRSDANEVSRILMEYAVVARVLLQTEEAAYPVLQDNRLLFPIGEFWTILCGPELEHALRSGRVKRVTEFACYGRDILFCDYVDFFQDLRDKAKARGDEAESDRAKRMQNHLYGKFGQNGRVFKIVGETREMECKSWVEIDAETMTVHKLRQYAGIIEEWQEEGESRDSHPAIASYVTSAARSYLWELISKAGTQNVFYCDTDSIWCNQAGYEALRVHIDPVRLGALKVESIHNQVEIHGLKDYVLDGKRRTKGVRDSAELLRQGVFSQTQFTNLKGLLQKGDLTAPYTRQITKHLTRRYTKGIVSPSGRVSPLRFTLGQISGSE